MKLLKRFCILLLLMAVLLLFFVGMTNIGASAETPEISVMESVSEEVVDSEEEMQNSSVFEAETSEEITSEYFGVIPETEESKWFEEHIQPYLMTALSVLAAFLTCIAFVIKPIAKVVSKFKDAKDELVSNNKENAEMRKNNDAWKEEVRKELKAEMDKRFSAMEKETHETHEGVKKLLKVDQIVFEDNPSMVSKGTSHKVAEVLNHEEA